MATMSKAMKMDKKADAMMTSAEKKQDAAADKKAIKKKGAKTVLHSTYRGK